MLVLSIFRNKGLIGIYKVCCYNRIETYQSQRCHLITLEILLHSTHGVLIYVRQTLVFDSAIRVLLSSPVTVGSQFSFPLLAF